MLLNELEIKNYRSLEHVTLTGLREFNVLIGRNNSGKSAVFGALTLLSNSIRGGGVEGAGVITAWEMSRSLEIRLVFHPSAEDRRAFLATFAGPRFEARREAMYNSALFRWIEFSFGSTPGNLQLMHLREMKISTEDGSFGSIQRLTGDENASNPTAKVCNLTNITDEIIGRVAVESDTYSQSLGFYSDYLRNGITYQDPAAVWLLHILDGYLGAAFFFNPFRHSMAQLAVQQSDQLAQDGSNLAQVLHTLLSNNRIRFDEVEKFLHAALPDVGRMQTPIIGGSTEVRFLAPDGDYNVRLHDMGGGVEQLLMVATVLLTTDSECSLFLEEPESHLHAGAQRFLIERLYQSNRQVFLTTHSPTFVNSPRQRSTYQVKFAGNRTTIAHITDADSLSHVLEDIGSRNSDVLLSDAVLFVEGPGDQRVLQSWSETLGMGLEEHNITVVPLGGGEYGERTARARSEVLEQISQKAPVPHLFILDRDERDEDSITRLQGSLGDKIHVLERRELENYLLMPRALLAALRTKYQSNAPIIEQIDAASDEQVAQVIKDTANNLFNTVLIKRIRAEIGGLAGGLLSRDMVAELIPHAGEGDLPVLLQARIEGRVGKQIEDLDLSHIVEVQRRKLTAEWADADHRLLLAPGEEIVTAVFHNYGADYKKPADTNRIAQEMTEGEIADEIKQLLVRVVALTNRRAA